MWFHGSVFTSIGFNSLFFPLTDVIGMTGGQDATGIRHDDDTSFPVKVQGAGVEPFELQVQHFPLCPSLFCSCVKRGTGMTEATCFKSYSRKVIKTVISYSNN